MCTKSQFSLRLIIVELLEKDVSMKSHMRNTRIGECWESARQEGGRWPVAAFKMEMYFSFIGRPVQEKHNSLGVWTGHWMLTFLIMNVRTWNVRHKSCFHTLAPFSWVTNAAFLFYFIRNLISPLSLTLSLTIRTNLLSNSLSPGKGFWRTWGLNKKLAAARGTQWCCLLWMQVEGTCACSGLPVFVL